MSECHLSKNQTKSSEFARKRASGAEHETYMGTRPANINDRPAIGTPVTRETITFGLRQNSRSRPGSAIAP
jgi:hypothetical protein